MGRYLQLHCFHASLSYLLIYLFVLISFEHGDEMLKKHLNNCKRNAMFTSKSIQNELLQSECSLVKTKIKQSVAETGF